MRQGRTQSVALQYFEAFLLAGATALLVRVFVLQAYRIPSSSMLPALVQGDYVFTSKLRYGIRNPFSNGWLWRYGSPRPGEVVVFVPPSQPEQEYVKRVVAVGGEGVEMRDGRALVDGRPRDMGAVVALAGDRPGAEPAAGDLPLTVPPGKLFVLGDNRDGSVDSRSWGFLDEDDVEGEAVLIYWSWNGADRTVRWERVGKLIK